MYGPPHLHPPFVAVSVLLFFSFLFYFFEFVFPLPLLRAFCMCVTVFLFSLPLFHCLFYRCAHSHTHTLSLPSLSRGTSGSSGICKRSFPFFFFLSLLSMFSLLSLFVMQIVFVFVCFTDCAMSFLSHTSPSGATVLSFSSPPLPSPPPSGPLTVLRLPDSCMPICRGNAEKRERLGCEREERKQSQGSSLSLGSFCVPSFSLSSLSRSLLCSVGDVYTRLSSLYLSLSIAWWLSVSLLPFVVLSL